MDKTINLKLDDFQKALTHLEVALQKKLDEDDFIRDAVVQRFEYTFEICFKTVKLFLLKNFGIEEGSPKGVFRSLLQTKLVKPSEIEVLLQMVDDRNKTTHTYDELFIETLYIQIQKYYKLMKYLFEIITNSLHF